jgi:enamine deaminase RidA (YjgF/YER057c/UK114 family)
MAANLPTFTVTDRHGKKTCGSGSSWEPKLGYSRAVRKGNVIAVTGTVGIGPDGKYSADVGAQAKRSLEIIEGALEALGAKITDVMRTRMFVTNITEWEKVAAVHGTVFGEIRPATTIVEVARLIDADALIEIEVDAIVG